MATHDRPERRPDDPGRVERQVDEVERRRSAFRGDLGREQPEDHRADRRRRRRAAPAASRARARTAGTSGMPMQDDRRHQPAPRSAPAGTRCGRRARPPSGPIERRRRGPPCPCTSPMAEASPGPVPTSPSTTTGRYGRAHLVGQERHAEDEEDAAHDRIGQDAAHGAERQAAGSGPAGRPRAGPRASRTSTSSAVPTDSAARQPEDRGQRPAEAVDEDAREGRPDRHPDRPDDAPKTPDDRAQPPARGDVADAGQHDPGVAELEADEEHAQARAARAPATGRRRRRRPPRRGRCGR